MRSRIIATFLLAGCAGGATPTVDVEADRAAIRAKVAEAVAAHHAADADAWASVTTDDFVLMADGSPTVTGRAAILEWIKAFYAANTISNMTIEPVEIEIAGDWAYYRGRISATLTPKAGGTPVPMDAKEIAIWRRQADGTWLASRAIFNSNLPPQPPM